MPFWTKPKAAAASDHALAAERFSAALAALEGERPCRALRCPLTTGVGCEYVDRRGRSCSTAWCPAHRLVVDGQVFCRRHAGVVRALAYSGGNLPDLENRAPSLVDWVCRGIDTEVRRLLLGELAQGCGAELFTDPVSLIFGGPERQRRWQRAWKLVEHTGHALVVAVFVDEDADTELGVRVNSNAVARIVPPWISQRDLGAATAGPAAQPRTDFNRHLVDLIRQAIRDERALGRIATPAGRVRQELGQTMATTAVRVPDSHW